MIKVEKLLQIAERRRNNGQLIEEQQLLLQILAENPDSSQANHLLGKNMMSMKQYVTALEYLQRAACLNMDDSRILCDLGYVYLETKQFDDALNCFRQSEMISPYESSIKIGLSKVYCRVGQYEQALRCAKTALRLKSESAGAYLTIGTALRESGEPVEAMRALERSLELEPDSWQALFEQALIHISGSQLEEALSKLVLANILSPLNPVVCLELCEVLLALNRIEEADILIEQLSSIIPGDVRAERFAAISLYRRGEPISAVGAFARALSGQPDNYQILEEMVSALVQSGKSENALKLCNDYLQKHEEGAHLVQQIRSRVELSLGKYHEGFEGMAMGAAHIVSDKPLWNGEPLNGKTLLVTTKLEFEEFGIFLRCLPFAKKREARILVEVTEPFRSLVSRLAFVDGVWEITKSLPDFYCYTTIEALPKTLGLTTNDMFDSRHKILEYTPREGEKVQRCENQSNMRVGLMWRNETHPFGDVYHSIPLDNMSPLFELENVTYVSMQTKAGQEEMETFANKDKIEISGLENAPFDERLNAISDLDLLISADTITARLASLAGIPVWAVLSSQPQWYFPLNETVSPWFPDIKQFRRERGRSWIDVFQRIRDELELMSRGSGEG